MTRLRAIENELEQLSHQRVAINSRPPGVGIEDRLRAIAEQERRLEVEHEALRNNQSKEAAA